MLRMGIRVKQKIKKIKSNASTDLRAEGDRLLDDPLVNMYIPQLIQQIKAETTWQNSDRMP